MARVSALHRVLTKSLSSDKIKFIIPLQNEVVQKVVRRSPNRTLRRSHSVMAYSPTRRVSSAKDDNTKVSERSRTHASMEEIFLEKKRPLQDIKNTQHVNVKDANKCNDKCTDNEDGEFSLAENSNSSSDYVVDALSRRKKKSNGQLMVRWILDRDCLICFQCNEKFSMIRRRHHCRACGGLFCAASLGGRKSYPT